MFPAIDPTPDSVARIYATTARNLAAARRRLGRPATLTDKVLLGHLDDPEHVEIAPGAGYVALRPDRVVFQDVLAQSAMLQFMQTGHDRVAVPATIHCDHLIRAETSAGPDLARSLAENGEVYDFLMAVAARYGCGFWRPGAGIVHQVVLENYAFPGQLLIGTDSHTPNAGGLGTCAVGVGGADAVEVIAGLPWELLYPTRIAVHLTGALGGWTAPKDVILKVAGILGVAGGTNAIIEYIGPGARTISATGKATIANMGAELGATTSLFPWDARMARYLAATGRQDLADVADRHRDLLVPDAEAEADPERHYDQVVAIDLSTLEPQISGPHSPDRVRPLSALAAEIAEPANGLVDRISAALIGSCTNSSYEDMGRAADIARQAAAHGMVAAVPFLVTPGSRRVGVTIERDGQMAALDSFGGTVLANACGPCIGQWRRDDPAADAPNTIVTSYNRNFPRRNDGKPTTMNLIASPEIVTALALAGRLSFDPARDALTAPDGKPFRLMPPAPAPDVPAEGFATVAGLYVAPPADGRGIAIAIDPASERLQALHPWPAWTGGDPQGLRVLAKTRGKTTTDHIAPAGPWLRYRGHLEKFSANLLAGAVDAFAGGVGRARDPVSGTVRTFAETARSWRDSGIAWVIVGDTNYGEGSSREHAALTPRLLGGIAVIARSFARIHETNLKKQGLLALTFRDPLDWERIGADDRIALVGVDRLAAGQPVKAIVTHPDGTAEIIVLDHSYSDRQVAWFRAGSALAATAAAPAAMAS